VQQAEHACAGGASVVQLRAKEALDRDVVAWGRAIREVTRAHGALYIVNDRFDLALATGADGVHLGQTDLPPDRIPEQARARLLIGRSTHTPAQFEAACAEPVDYVAFGPVFGTTSKDSAFGARGIPALEAMVRCVAPRPAVAIGGIDASNLGAVARTGATAAVISAVAGADDPTAAARALARILATETAA
jgi:thiamine-phosphate pyrophosphorylase